MQTWVDEARFNYKVNFTEAAENLTVAMSHDRRDAWPMSPEVVSLTGKDEDIKPDENGVICLKANRVYMIGYGTAKPRIDLIMDVTPILKPYGITCVEHFLRANQEVEIAFVVSMFKQMSFNIAGDPLLVLRYL